MTFLRESSMNMNNIVQQENMKKVKILAESLYVYTYQVDIFICKGTFGHGAQTKNKIYKYVSFTYS